MNRTDDGSLDAELLLDLAVLMAVHDAPLDRSALAERVGRLAAPGFPADAEVVAAAADRLWARGDLAWQGDTMRATPDGRARAAALGARTPGSACDSSRVCLLLRLCLDDVMPAGNRRVLVERLLAGGAPEND